MGNGRGIATAGGPGMTGRKTDNKRQSHLDFLADPAAAGWLAARMPVWLSEAATGRIVFANAAALVFWGATSVADLETRALPDHQPGLGALARIGANLARETARIERLRLHPKGQYANLACRCRWRDLTAGRYVEVTVLDPVALPSGDLLDGEPRAFARAMLAGVSEAALVLNGSGRILFASPKGEEFALSLANSLDLPQLAAAALHDGAAAATRHGRIPLQTLRIALPGDTAPIVLVRPAAVAARQDTVSATPEMPQATEVIFKPEFEPYRPLREGGDTAVSSRDDSRDDSSGSGPGGTPAGQLADDGAAANILPFRGLTLHPAEGVNLDQHERDAFRALARALGARIEGDTPGEPARSEPAPSRPTGQDLPPDAAVADMEIFTLLSRLPLGLLIYRGTTPLYANRAFLDLFGYGDMADLKGTGDITRLLPRLDMERDGLADTSAGAPAPARLMARDRSGLAFPVCARLHAVRWGGDTAMLLSVRGDDMPARAETEAPPLSGIPTRGTELAAILRIAGDGLIILAEDGHITSANENAATLLARDAGTLAGERFDMLFTDDCRAVVAHELSRLRRRASASAGGGAIEAHMHRADGGVIPVSLALGALGEEPERRWCAVIRDIAGWKNHEAELIRARIAAETANTHKTDFLARISHEIRTPLNSIIGFSEVMKDERFGPVGSDRYRDYVRDIHSSGLHLMGLINDLLDLSKVEAGKLELNFTGVDVNQAALDCMRLMQPEANRSRIIVRSSLARRIPPVVADEKSLRQILLNLLSNAVKFTLPGGQIVLSTMLTEKSEVQIRVRDSGIGMEASELAMAMEPFRQVATARVARLPGTGLGLPLTKGLVEANRARFRIESTPGQGTLTEVTFPTVRVLEG